MSHILCCANSSERDGYVPRWWRRCHGWRTAALGPCRWLAIHSALEIHDALGLLFSLSLLTASLFPYIHSGFLIKHHSAPLQHRLLHQPTRGLAPSYLCLFSTGDVRALNCLAQPRQIPITSDAICSQRCTGAKMEALAASLSLMSEIKCYAWQSLPKMKFFATRRYIWGIRSKSVWCHSRMGRRGRFASGGEFLLCLYIFMYVCLCICNIYVNMKQRLCLCG